MPRQFGAMLRGVRIRARSDEMKTHEFTIVATGLDPEMEGYEDRFYEAGCDDATLSFQKGVIIAEFRRTQESHFGRRKRRRGRVRKRPWRCLSL
jgi:hypothetical protein